MDRHELASQKELIKVLCEIGAIKFGEFTLKSGKKSPYYIDLRILSSYPNVLKQVGRVMGGIILNDPEKPDVLCGVPYAGLAIANAISLETSIPVIYVRKEPVIYKELSTHLRKQLVIPEEEGGFSFDEKTGIEKALDIIDSLSGLKTHGITRYADGEFKSGSRIGIVDDLVTTAESKLEVRDLVLLEANRRELNVNVVGVYVLLDREQGGREFLEKEGVTLHAAATIRQAAEWLQELRVLTPRMYQTILDYTISDRKAMGLE